MIANFYKRTFDEFSSFCCEVIISKCLLHHFANNEVGRYNFLVQSSTSLIQVLTYLKEQCKDEEIKSAFFLHKVADESSKELDIKLTFSELELFSGCALQLSIRTAAPTNQAAAAIEAAAAATATPSHPLYLNNKSNEPIEIICSSRAFESDGSSLKQIRVLVNKFDELKYLMHDISELWDREGLKFKFGRLALLKGNTYDEIGIENGDEITVSGGNAPEPMPSSGAS